MVTSGAVQRQSWKSIGKEGDSVGHHGGQGTSVVAKGEQVGNGPYPDKKPDSS